MSPLLEVLAGSSVSFGGGVRLHPITVTVIIGIAMQGLAECFLSPRFLEYASRQAPPGEEGLYMGYQHLTTFFAWAFGFAVSGHLLERFCPDPKLLDPQAFAQWQAAISTGLPMPDAYANAHYIWFAFAVVGFAAFLALLMFKVVTAWIDRAAPTTAPAGTGDCS
jgi:dipeptide/tripeptide permease